MGESERAVKQHIVSLGYSGPHLGAVGGTFPWY